MSLESNTQEDIIKAAYLVARSIIAQNPALWQYNEWDETRRSLQAFSDASLYTLCLDLLEQSVRSTLPNLQHHLQLHIKPEDQSTRLSKLSQKDLEGLCAHVYYETTRRLPQISDSSERVVEGSDSKISVSMSSGLRTNTSQGNLSTSALSLISIEQAPVAPMPKTQTSLSVLDLCWIIYQMSKDKSKYRALLGHKEDNAQLILDFLQMALDFHGLNAKLQKCLLVTALRLSAKASLYPTCFTLDDIVVEESAITAGHFGEIWKGRFRGQTVCLKVVKVYQRSHIDGLLKAFSKEGILWSHLRHENVLPFYGIYHLADTYGRICLTSPWMDCGNVNEHLRRNPNVQRIFLALDIVEGISYLHSNGIIHGDLKGANILIAPGGRACLADFGLSSVALDAEILRWTSFQSSTSIGGTVRWSAPELMDPENENSRPSMATDMYAFACVCYEVFTGNNPFFEIPRDPAVMLKVMRGGRPTLPALDSPPSREWGLTPSVRALMEHCWQQVPSERPAASEAIDSIHSIIRSRVATDGAGFSDDRPLAAVPWEPISPSKFRNSVQQSVNLQAVQKLLLNLLPPLYI